MKIHVLGSSGGELPGHNLPAFLIDGFMLLDAGTVSHVLDHNAQRKISHILLTHAHFDHIKGIPFLLDSMINGNNRHRVNILSGRDVLRELKTNIFNDKIWPDFTTIPDRKNALMKYQAISTTRTFKLRDFKICATRVSHPVPSYGYIIEDAKGHALVYTGDTGPTKRLWQRMGNYNTRALIIEVSFPDSMNKQAVMTGHLTPSLLAGEIKKMTKLPEKIYINHIKPRYKNIIERELRRLKGVSIEILRDNTMISL